ncbi:unnamed protein product [Pseudo-nitzschia multistriata]|uniref:Uncharacterized protein n=1 Tax=Pseudo-nitzschia multistriata TaxID=183589 RepID=A0A448ZA48_9STRA|nr:unnamed protein product [Pseudo-nitzschia multistriata]
MPFSTSPAIALRFAAIAGLVVDPSSAFVANPRPPLKTKDTALSANSKNIRAAMEATERYGIHSPQAKVAWEIVEEFDASTNDSAAYTPNREGGLSQEELNQAYQEVQASMEIMQRNQYAAVSFQNNQQLMKDVAAELQAIKLSPPAKKPAPTIPGLWDAKLKARALSQQFGNQSPQAKLAWEEVEEIASSGLNNAVGGNLYQQETCDLVQAAEACMALEELDRFLYYENYHVGDNIENNDQDSTGYYSTQNNEDYGYGNNEGGGTYY